MYVPHGYAYGMVHHTRIKLRPTTLADLALLPAIERSAARAFLAVPALAFLAQEDAGVSESQHRECIAQNTSWVALGPAPHLCGFLCARKQGNALHILEVSVAQQEQGKGVGKALVHLCCAEAKQQGFKSVTLTTFYAVPWNRPFYEKLGFEALKHTESPAFLQALVQAEEAHGFPTESRCAMRKTL